MSSFLRRRKRHVLLATPLSEEQQAILDSVPYYHLLNQNDQDRLPGIIQVLLHEKNFEGCGGLALTDEMRIVIASHAGVLLLGQEFDFFGRLASILVYPNSFLVQHQTPFDSRHALTGEDVRTGESWSIGALILSWDDVARDSARLADRHVVMHEFAHQLDQADGSADGWPSDLDPQMEPAWSAIMNNEFERLQEETEAGSPTFIRNYGATKPSEFFAVVSELFFLQPRALQSHHPDLYALLQAFYAQDPAARFPGWSAG